MRCGTTIAALALAALVAPPAARAQEGAPPTLEPEERVLRYDLGGPRLGATFTPRGEPTTQFGWHFEHQVAPDRAGPWFLVETVLLAGGLESDRLVPSGSLIFGMRLPSSFEFGIGPSVSIGGPSFGRSGVVIAAGQSLRCGGIRVPLNLAVTLNREGEERWTLLTGWAIRSDP